MRVDNGLVKTVNGDNQEHPMSTFQSFRARVAASHRRAQQQRALSRALATASTPSLRQELLSLTTYDNR